MADPRNILQASFDEAKRYAHYGELLLRLHVTGIRTHANTVINIESPVTAFCGVNGTGKSTLLQLAASAYQSDTARYYISTFILAGSLDTKPFLDDAAVEYTYAEAPSSDDRFKARTLTLSRSGSSWSGYERQPKRRVSYLGSGFFVPHAERDNAAKAPFNDASYLVRSKSIMQVETVEWVSKILLCKYDAAHTNALRKKYGRSHTHAMSAKRDSGLEYSEANMGSGEARLYALVTKVESVPEKSLVLIEEPEIALHPCAQYELGRYLVQRAMERKLQILLTTHSEYLLLALPQKSRIYLKREGRGVSPIPGIGVRQAVSMMDDLAVPSIYILVEDDVAEAIVAALLRKHDPEFRKTVRIVVAGDKTRIKQMADVFEDQKLPICAVRDGDVGAEPKLKVYKLFGSLPPEKEVFKSVKVREYFRTIHSVDWDAIDIANKGKDHHHWFDTLATQTALKREELLSAAAQAYLEGIPEIERRSLVEQIKASVP